MKIKLSITNLLVYLLTFILCTLDIFKTFSGNIRYIYQLSGYASIIILGYLIWKYKKVKVVDEVKYILFLLLWLFICNMLQTSYDQEVLFAFAKIFVFYIVVNQERKRSQYTLICCTQKFAYATVVLNLATQFLFPNGVIDVSKNSWQNFYLLQNCNAFAFFYIFALGLTLFVSFSSFGKVNISSYILYGVELLSYLKEGENTSTTGIFTTSLMIIGAVLLQSKIIRKCIKFIGRHIVFFIGGIIALFMSITLNEIFRNNIVLPVINALTGDDFSFKARTIIWSNSIRNFLRNPVFGSGTLSTRNIFSSLDGKLTSSHNNFLQLANYGGFVALVVFIILIIISLKHLVAKKNKNVAINVIFFTEIIYIFQFMVEQHPLGVYFYYIVIIGTVFVREKNQVERICNGKR